MSWEIMNEWKEQSVCACGKGFVTRICYREGDDWNRFREGNSNWEIECEECSEKYHIEGEYLVPKGKTIDLKTSPEQLPFEYNINFENRAVALFTIEELKSAVEDMKSSKFSTRLSLDISKKLVDMYYRAKKLKKLTTIIDALMYCINNYDDFEWNYDKVKEYRKQEVEEIIENEKVVNKVLSESFKLKY